MNEEYLKELIVGIRVFLWMLSIKIKALSLTEFWKLLEGCSSQQKLYAVWLTMRIFMEEIVLMRLCKIIKKLGCYICIETLITGNIGF